MFFEVLSIVGALSWTPFFYKSFVKAKIKGRLTGFVSHPSEFLGEDVCLNVLTFNVISLKKNYQIKDIEVKVKYKNIEDEFKGKWIYLRYFLLPQADGYYLLNPDPKNVLPYVGTLVKDQSQNVNIIFKTSVDAYKVKGLERAVITFIDYNDKRQIITLEGLELEKIVFNDRDWKKISNDEAYELRRTYEINN